MAAILLFQTASFPEAQKTKKIGRSKTKHRGVSMSSFVTFFGDLLSRAFWRRKSVISETLARTAGIATILLAM